jgi:hypothetical protein
MCVHSIQHPQSCCALIVARAVLLDAAAAVALQVPEHIQRPDYAVTGVPTSELESKQQRAGAPGDAGVAVGGPSTLQQCDLLLQLVGSMRSACSCQWATAKVSAAIAQQCDMQ